MVASEQDDNESLQLSDIETQERFSSQDGDEDALWSVDEITGEKDQRYKVKWSGVDPKTNRPWPQSWVAKKDVTLPVVVKWKTKKALKKKEAERRKSLKRRESTASKRTHASTVSRSTAGSSGTPLTVTAKPTAKKAASSESSTKTVRANAASVSTAKPDDIPLLGKRRRGSIASNSSWDLPEVGSLFPAPPDANQAKKKRKIVPDDAGDHDVEDNGEDVRDWPTHLPSPPPLPLSQTSSRRRILAPSTEGSDFRPGLLIRDDETPAAGPSSKAAKGKERRPPSDDEDTDLDYRKVGPPPRRGSRVTRASGKSASSSVTTKGGDNGVANGIAHPDKTVAHKSATRKGPPPPLKGNSKSGSTSRAALSKSIPRPKSPLPASTRRATRQPLFLKDPDEGNGGETEDEEDAESETEKVRKGIKKQGDVVVVKHKKSRKAAEVDEEEQEEEEGESEVSTKMVSRHASSKPPSKTVSNPPLPPQAPPAKRNRQMVVELASPARVQKPLATVEQPPSTRPPPDHVPIPNTRNTLKLTHSRKLSDGTLARLKEFDEEVGMTGYPIPDISDPAPSALPEPAPLAKRGSSGVRESTITTGAVAGPSRSKTTAASNQRTGGNDSEVVPGTETQSSQSQSQSQPQAPPFASLPGANTRPRALPSTNPLPALNTLHAPTARKVPTSSTIHPSTVPIPAGPSSRPSIPPIATVEVDTRTSPGPSRPPSESAVTKPAPLPAPPPLRTPIRSSGSLAGKMKPRTPGSRRSTMLSVLEQDLAVPEPLLDGAEYPGEPTEGEDEESYHPGQPDAGVEDADGEGDQMDVDVESESEEERRRKARSSDRGKGVKREKENQVHRSKDKDKTKRPEKQLKPLPHLSPSKFAPYLSSSSPPDDISSRRPRGRGKSSKTATIFDRRRGMVQRQSDPVNDSIESFSSPIKKTSTKKTSMGKVLVPSSSSQSQPPATVAPAATGPVEVNEISASDKDLVEKVRKEILLAASGGAKKPTLLKWMKETKAKQANEAQGGKEKVWDSSIRQFSSSNPQQQKEKQVHTVDEQPTVEELEEAYVDLSGATPGEDGGADVALDDRDEDQESRYEEEMVEEEVTIEDEDADADAEDELDDDDNRPVQPIPEEEEESTQDIMQEMEVLKRSRSSSGSKTSERGASRLANEVAEDDDEERSVRIQRQEVRSSVPPEPAESQQVVQDSQEQEGVQAPENQGQDPDQSIDDDEQWSRRPDRDHEHSQPMALEEDDLGEIQSQAGSPKPIRRQYFNEDMDQDVPEEEHDPRDRQELDDEPNASYSKSTPSIPPPPPEQSRRTYRRSVDIDEGADFEELPPTASSATGTATPALMSYEAPPSTQPETMDAALALLHAKSNEIIKLEEQLARARAKNDRLTSEKDALEELLDTAAKELPTTSSQPQPQSQSQSPPPFEPLSQLQSQPVPQSQMVDVDMESQPPASQPPTKSIREEELEAEIRELHDRMEASRSAWESEKIKLEDAVKSAREKHSLAEKDKEIFRGEYMRASEFTSSLRKENVELQKQATIAQGQAQNGVELVKATFEARSKTLEKDRDHWKMMALFAVEKDQRTNDEIRRKAAEHPELERRCREFESKFVDLRTKVVDLEVELESKNRQEEEQVNEKMEWEREREDKDEEVRMWKTRVEQLERETASRNLNGKAVLNDNDLVFRCLWRPRESDSACESVFLSTQDLEQHMYDAGHIHD